MSWKEESNPFSLFTGIHEEATEQIKKVIANFIKDMQTVEKTHPCCGMSDTAARECIAQIVSEEVFDKL